MREKFTRNIFLIVRPSYIRATIARPCLCVCMCETQLFSSSTRISSPPPPLLSFFPPYDTISTKLVKDPFVWLTLQLVCYYCSRYRINSGTRIRVRIFMIMPMKYTTVEKGRTDRREIDRVLDVEEDHSSAVQPPLKLPFEETFERIYIYYVYRHTDPYVIVSFAPTWKISFVLADLSFTISDRFLCHGRTWLSL